MTSTTSPMTDTENLSFGGFSPGGRAFWIRATDLVVSRGWYKETFAGVAGAFSTSIRGKAVSEDSVCVIGKNRETSEFGLVIRSDAFAKQEWDDHRRNAGLETKNNGTTPALRLRALTVELLNKDPPTA